MWSHYVFFCNFLSMCHNIMCKIVPAGLSPHTFYTTSDESWGCESLGTSLMTEHMAVYVLGSKVREHWRLCLSWCRTWNQLLSTLTDSGPALQFLIHAHKASPIATQLTHPNNTSSLRTLCQLYLLEHLAGEDEERFLTWIIDNIACGWADNLTILEFETHLYKVRPLPA